MTKGKPHLYYGRGIRIAPSKAFGDVMKEMPTNFPRTHDEIYNFYEGVHKAAYPEYCISEYKATLSNLVNELFQLQNSIEARYNAGDLDMCSVTKVAYFAASQVMDDTWYLPHFIHAGLCLFVCGVFGDHSHVSKNANALYHSVENASRILEQVEMIHGDETSDAH